MKFYNVKNLKLGVVHIIYRKDIFKFDVIDEDTKIKITLLVDCMTVPP